MNIFKIKSLMTLAAVGLMALTACNSEGDKMDYGKNRAYITGTDSYAVVKFKVDDTPASYALTVNTAYKVDKNTTVKFAVDPDALETFNQTNGTTLVALPAENYTISATESVIEAGTSYSAPVSITITSTEGLRDELVYAIPVSVVDAGGIEVLDAQRTIYLQIARTIQFTALNMSNTGMYSNFIFDEPIELANYTYEVKFYSENWHSIARLMNFCESDESNQSMFRFGEGGYPVNSCQWVTPSGVDNMVTNTTFDTNRWYTLSVTYDGATFAIYVDGVKDRDTSGSVGIIKFQRIELGMSWTSYPGSQYFRGRIAEIRVWDRALSPAEIQGNLCGCDPQADGLRAYWKLNEGDGHIFHDNTGNGYDMDWSMTKREKTEGRGLEDTPEAANNVSWTNDDRNKCAQ